MILKEIALSLSNSEAVKVGDIITFAEHIESIIEGLSPIEFAKDIMRVYAVERCLQNISEACIQLNAKRGAQRFSILFPEFDFADIRDIGNLLRHDYGAFSYERLLDECHLLVPQLKSRAKALLVAHRRLHGQGG